MAVYNLGSINIDHVYRVNQFPAAGETMASEQYMRSLGGKGANQSIALARAGAGTHHIGAINAGDTWLSDEIAATNVDMSGLQHSEMATGHAIVSVNDAGENQILLYAGANHDIDMKQAIAMLDNAVDGDWVLLQNETNGAKDYVAAAKARGLNVAYSAAPFDADIAIGLLDSCDLLIVNEGEAAALSHATGNAASPADLGIRHLVITKGGKGATYYGDGQQVDQPAFAVDVVDTTGAGDCFYGFFLAAIMRRDTVEQALLQASAAAAIQVTQQGAANAIPSRQQVLGFIEQQQVRPR